MKLTMGSGSAAPPKVSDFSVYDGPLPKNGMYNAKIEVARMQNWKDGKLNFMLLIELTGDDTDESKNIYTGAPVWYRIYPGDAEIQIKKVDQLIHAVSGKGKAAIDFDDPDGEGKGKINNIGGKAPQGALVKVNLARRNDNEGNPQVEVTELFARKGSAAVVADTDDGYTEPEADEAATVYTASDLEALKLPGAKKLAKDEFGATVTVLKGMDLAGVVGWILEKQGGEVEEETPIDWPITTGDAEQFTLETLIAGLVEAGYDAADLTEYTEAEAIELLKTEEMVVEGQAGPPF